MSGGRHQPAGRSQSQSLSPSPSLSLPLSLSSLLSMSLVDDAVTLLVATVHPACRPMLRARCYEQRDCIVNSNS
jgi:hypothetical protein